MSGVLLGLCVPIFVSTIAAEPVASLMDQLTEQLQVVAAEAGRETQLQQALGQPVGDLDRLVQAVLVCFPETDSLLNAATLPPEEAWPVPASFPAREKLLANLKLYFGRELIRIGLADEGLDLLAQLTAADTVDPASFHFYKAVAHYQTADAEGTLTELDLLQQLESVPVRYADTAKLMRFELASLKPESLQAIAHDMRRLSQRLDNGRAGEKVQVLEREVVDRLDKLIEELEKQQQQQQQSNASNTNQPNAPMEDSRLPGGGTGDGEVGNRILKISSDWGKLPEKERERALQQLDRRFPGHYREAVEEYFRRLAETEGDK